MPDDNPEVGETWELTVPGQPQSSLGVVTRFDGSIVTLMSRRARMIAVPIRSFRLSWVFLQAAPAQRCGFAGCSEQAIGRIEQSNTWTWTCAGHFQAGTPLILPADRVIDRERACLESCPSCRAQAKDSASRQIPNGLVLHHCEACRREWVLIPGLGRHGNALADLVGVAMAHVARPDRALAGHVAYRHLRGTLKFQTLTTWNSASISMHGTTIVSNDDFGADNIVLLSRPNPVQEPDPEVVTQGPEITPVFVGTQWRDTRTVPDQVSEQHQATVTVIQHLVEPQIVEIRRDNGDTELLREQYFYEVFRRPTEADYVLRPYPGQTWGKGGDPRDTARVMETRLHEGRMLVRFLNRQLESVTMWMVDFLDLYVMFEPNCPVEVGDEWWDSKGRLVIVRDVIPSQGLIVLDYVDRDPEPAPAGWSAVRGVLPASTFTVTFSKFGLDGYRRLVRRSAYERLISDDDDDL